MQNTIKLSEYSLIIKEQNKDNFESTSCKIK